MARFFRRGVSQIRFLPAVSNAALPSSGEISAGTDLTPEVADISGYMLENKPIETPDLKTTFDTQINGPDQTADSKITFYDQDNSATIRVALAKGANGFILLAPYGMGTGKRAEIWPVRSTGVNDEWDLGAKAAHYVVGFAVTALPTQTATLP